jgi:hypothetical protein
MNNLEYNNLEYNNFEDFLIEKLKEKNFNLKKLSEVSGISLKNLENLIAENFSELPAMPYIRGYLITLGKILNFDYEIWWNYFKNKKEIKKSGIKDALPQNRFIAKSSLKPILIILISIIVLVYFVLRFNFIFGKPILEVNIPSELIKVNDKNFVISGFAKSADKVFINNQEINLSNDGGFNKEVILESGINNFEIKAQKVLGKETKIIRQIFYEEKNLDLNSTSSINLNN